MKKTMMFILALLVVTLCSSAIADPYADTVISYTEGPDVSDDYDNPDAALGVPDHINAPGLFVSLGNGGEIELAFTDNVIVDEIGNDLVVYEVGGTEYAEVFVSNDCGSSWTSLGSGTTSGTSVGTAFSFDLSGSGLSWANAIKIVDDEDNSSDYPWKGFDLDAVEALNSEDIIAGPSIEKIKISGPDEIGICLPTETVYVFEITYSGPPALIIDTVPAEFDVISALPSDGVDISPAGKGPKSKSATIISWSVDGGEGICAAPPVTLTVTIETRESPGGGHKLDTFKPTSCEEDMELNDGATAYEVDGEGNPVFVDGEMVIIVGPTEPLLIDAVCGAKPCAPTDLVVTQGGTGELLLDWEDVDCGGPEVKYNVYRDGEQIAGPLGNSDYADSGLTTGVEYCYEVEAEYVPPVEGLESDKSEEVCEYAP